MLAMKEKNLRLIKPTLCVLLTGGDEEKDFYIQKNTGTISIARRLDGARRSEYNMTVQVTDGHQNATTQVRITKLKG